MKKISLIFFQVVIVLISIVVLYIMIRLPLSEGRAQNLDLVSIYSDPFIIYGYVSSIVFFVALFKVFKWASLHLSAQYFLYPVAVDNQSSRKLAEFLGGTVAAHKTERKYEAVIYHIPPYQIKAN